MGTNTRDNPGTMRREPFRSDIQGLRGIAVGLVVLYHAGLPFLPGGYVGVDIFFVISGFLITNHLLSNLGSQGRIGFAAFYARRARRILPASFVVLAASVVAGIVLLPPLQLRQMLLDALATAFYVPNIAFARAGTDYLSDSTPSLFQHYWSLGVEEQFYLFWPLGLFLLFALFKGSRRWMLVGVVVVVILSFVAGVILTTISQPWAFFSLPTRAWELGVGGIVAFLGARQWRILESPVASVLTWCGILGIGVATVFYNDATAFPGYAAALPVLSTAAVIFFGRHSPRLGAGVLLNRRPLGFVGKISYSLYLVHWPILILATQYGGAGTELPLVATLGLSVAGVGLAYLLYRFVEEPAQRVTFLTRARPRRSLLAAGLASVIVGGAVLVAIPATAAVPLNAHMSASAASLDELDFTTEVPANLRPALRGASSDMAEVYALGCHLDFKDTQPKGCRFGDADAPVTVALFGDSHAAQWFPALQVLAERGEISLRVDTKSSCPSVDVVKVVQRNEYTACETWRDNVVEELNAERPDVVIMSNYALSDGLSVSAQEWADGLESTITALDEVGRVIVIADTPTFPFVPSTCLSAHLSDASACSISREQALDEEIQAAERAAVTESGAEYLDFSDEFCTQMCGPIVGDVLVYRDFNHITATYSSLFADSIATALE